MRIKPKTAAGASSVDDSDQKELRRLEKLCQLMARNQIAELEWERRGEKLRLRSALTPAFAGPQHITHQFAAPAAPAVATADVAPALSANQKQVTSPFVGTFYRAPAPTAEPYAREGQMIKKGDVLCIIEAMKLMNEIEAEISGKVISILVENGQPVEFGEPLFVIETN
ncbi:MAG TPA: acetyl-CoA carboxylase biotin carboxyl carrier protein [Bdellovibrionales bacterium]|nr:MAG: acetyl-CoA carboxylase, biotin carboxyl carrier protein [Bdellovibrionales bacterium GWB1_52_6]OFZ02533.1 MAG: acetyl-CoA carboxylase, biotin carboxyl carrier protein [Bdellovibrionales bacterium GWA1_52_35]OFZ34614.1 MAG: acetyl-CoA carboxylase, biotin carboxyl carrier protein [Bdellovibrionales bacterium GWC1_52_8]HAR43707.1 acetyl-CoA carboxylase biotin carboxyl carrier protein [Bdellovibrionales bacterium]HCM41381.1 acetyl-CoA carboxylase biotin carboxyl carrier protein [Bdellovibri